MNYIIRKANIDDISAIDLLEKACIEVAWSFAQLSESFNSPLYDFFVADFDGEIIGYGFIQYCLDEGNICNVATAQQFRNKGVASSILNTMQATAKSKGISSLLLEVNENNCSAIALYNKHGFTAINVRKGYYKGENAVVMQKII